MTTKTKIAITAAAACMALGTPVYLQQREIRILKEENQALRSAVQSTAASGVRRTVESPSVILTSVTSGEAVDAKPKAVRQFRNNRSAPARTGFGSAAGSTGADGVTIGRTGASEATSGAGLPGMVTPTNLDRLGAYEDSFVAQSAAPLVAGKLHWDHGQATGPPDTKEAGDIPTAWAPLEPKSGEQWLGLEYDRAVEIKEINIHETHNPGAVSRVAAVMPDGKEKVLWQGTASPVHEGEDSLETTLPVPRGTTASQIRVYVDTNRVESWPEIDAVELVGTSGTRQWASKSSASSSYSENYGRVTAASGAGTGFGSGAGLAEGSSR